MIIVQNRFHHINLQINTRHGADRPGDWDKARAAAAQAYTYLKGDWWNAWKSRVKTRDGKPFSGEITDFLAASDISDASMLEIMNRITGYRNGL